MVNASLHPSQVNMACLTKFGGSQSASAVARGTKIKKLTKKLIPIFKQVATLIVN